MSKKLTLIIVSLLVIGLVVSGFFVFGDFIQRQVLDYKFVNPDWARLECAPTPAYEGEYIRFLNQMTTFNCDAFTEECRFKITLTETGLLDQATGEYRICNLDGTNCDSWINYGFGTGHGSDESNWIFINVGKRVQFKTGVFVLGEDKTKITLEWRPWKLYQLGGVRKELNPFNCDITAEFVDFDLIRKEDKVVRLYREGGEGQRWINYVNAWNLGPATNVFTHPTYGEVYCNSREIFEIVTLEMSDGKLVQLEPSYSGELYNGEVLKGQGRKLGDVQCCPGELDLCGDDFKFKDEPQGGDCFTDSQCFNSGNRICDADNKQFTNYGCINGKCQLDGNPTPVECCTNAQCPTGEICSLAPLNYGVCIKQTGQDYCGDGICSSTENTLNCPDDCGPDAINCKPNEIKVETCGLLCSLGLADPEFKCVQKECESCINWGMNFFVGDDKQCAEGTFFESDSTFGKLLGIRIGQNEGCLFLLIMVLSVFLMFALIIILILKKGGSR